MTKATELSLPTTDQAKAEPALLDIVSSFLALPRPALLFSLNRTHAHGSLLQALYLGILFRTPKNFWGTIP